MSNNKNLVEQIMAEPTAPLIVKHVSDLLAEEQRKRHEFYEMIDEDTKAEYVNGEVIYHSPVVKEHTDSTKLLLRLLDTFVDIHELGWVGVEKAMVTLTRNDYEPDICFFGNRKADQFRKGQLHYPAPDFVAEILSKSNQKMINHDRVTKYEDYELHQVNEYWIIDPDSEVLEQHLLENGKYQLNLKASEGKVHSRVIAGFSIPIRAIFNIAENIEVLREILK
ncbi:MAG TPA: Uma2 family endonuclease [Bacteroidetes bacterium]|nr:Uma2 family endonuclease [Bacteroidota bacterium]